MKEKENKKKSKGIKNKNTKVNRRRVIAVVMIAITTLYIIYVAVLLNKNELSTIYVEQGTIQQEETVVGYIVRNEKVVKNEEYQHGIVQIAGEGEKVYKNEAIFQYYSDEAKDISNHIIGLDLQIQEKLKSEKITSNSDIKLIETQIETKLENLKNLNNIQEIAENNKSIKQLLDKKILMLGEINGATKELKELVKAREELNKKISSSTKYLTAPISGVVSYRVDGLEEMLTLENFNNLGTEFLEELNLKTGQIVSTSGEAGKVIDNFTYYIATPMKSKEAMEAIVGNKVKIRLSTNDEIQAQIVHINEEENQRVIIFKIDRLTENLTSYRKISFDVIWWSDSGLKVPNKAIGNDEQGLSYLIRTKSGYLSKLLVKIVNSNENYSIVTTYSTEELTNLEFTQEEISDYKKVKLYDEVLVDPTVEELK